MAKQAIEVEVFDHSTRTTIVSTKYWTYKKASESAEKLSRKYNNHCVYLFEVNLYGTHITRQEWKDGVHDKSSDYTWRIGN